MSNPVEPHQIYRFGEFSLNTATGVLLQGSDEVRIRSQSFAVLQYLLEHHACLVSRDELHAEVWGQKAVTDDSLAQCLTEIRRALADVDRKMIRTVPRRGYLFAADVTVEAVDTAQPVKKTNHQPSWRWLGVAALFVAVAWFAVSQMAGRQLPVAEPPMTTNSVAVLPFTNMSSDPDNEYFSDGLSETILHKLAGVPDLKVAGRLSSFAFKGKDTDIREIGIKLGVDHVLEGSVRRADDRVRITAQLVRTDDGFHLWSETYDRELHDVFAIQDEIAAAVGVKLLASLFKPAQVRRERALSTSNVDAYDWYLRAQRETHLGNLESMKKAETYLLKALNEDPEFIDAKVELADLVIQQADTGLRTIAEGVALQAALIREVLEVDPNHPKARSLVIATRVVLASNNSDFSAWKNAEPVLREILAAAPDDIEAKIWLGNLLERFGQHEEAATIFKEAIITDPLNSFLYEKLSQTYQSLGEHAAARDVLLRAVEIQPEAPNTWAELGKVGVQLGDGVLAVDSYLQSQAHDVTDPDFPGRLATFLYLIGLPAEANEFHHRVRELAPDSENIQNLDLLQAVALGDIERALQLARNIIDDGSPERAIAWRNAAYVILFTSAERGQEKEDLAFINEYVVGFTDLQRLDIPFRANIARTNSFDVFAATNSKVEIKMFGERMSVQLRQANIEMSDFPHVYLDWKLIFGDTAGAKDLALKVLFSKPVTTLPLWRLRFKRPFMREIMGDPEIKAALKRWDEDEERIRNEIRTYLAVRG